MTVPASLTRPMSYAYKMFTTSMRMSNAKARTELGWLPRYADCAGGLAAMSD
ncbi:hypothetical protein [Streptomyces zaomyceticus]|uniref:hypothetical protein n=1 Tax=Streptomyces zaomyceticus TaxID=68286 RepID=UPI0034208087